MVYFGFPEKPTVFNLTLGITIILYLLVLQFFRNPKVVTPVNDKHVVAPADGKVVVIEETTETEYLKDKRIQVSIFMSPVNVHVNRMPVKGAVEFFKYHAGKYLVAWHPKSSIENERTTLVVKTPSGIPILMRQIAGALARRIKWYVKEGQEFEQGQEFGFIKFGSRVDVFLPLDAKVKVNIGDKTKGGMTVLAELD
ncbi:Phosphatidylserine decarboxylase [Fulvivirga imtechensis AK7]|uniref:Phosphatidylserine decarboxylase proenzyme n=2 Tax=Fulvivirga TaxID=396811 RepID=L8JW30_9BACT|nr:Phosphatidylserine decarboxylase [Fulvivirga imtechensis AK7]